MKKLIVACGSGVATSQTVASKVERLLKEANVPVVFILSLAYGGYESFRTIRKNS